MISPFEQDGRHQRLEVAVNAKTLRLGCTPIINLFAQTAEPILVDQTRYQYPIVPDARRRQTMEIYSVDEVVSTDAETHQTVTYSPALFGAARRRAGTTPAYWYVTRSASTRKGDEGTDVFLSLVDLSARPMQLDYDTVTVRCTCTNRDLVTRLPFGSENGDFEMTGAAAIKRIVALHKPTKTLRPPLDGKTLWSLISQLSLNYLSIVDDGKEALQKILELYDFSDSPDTKKQIGGITSVDARRHFTRVISEHGIGFARGTRVEIEFDEEQFSGGGAYLFASVIEKFFGLYVSMNSFSQLVARSRQRKEPLEEWPPRAGQSILIYDLAASEVAEKLRREPFSFDFFQAVRLLERMFPERTSVGQFSHPDTEVARFGVHPSLAFPASQIQAMDWPEQKPAKMVVQFHGADRPRGSSSQPLHHAAHREVASSRLCAARLPGYFQSSDPLALLSRVEKIPL